MKGIYKDKKKIATWSVFLAGRVSLSCLERCKIVKTGYRHHTVRERYVIWCMRIK